MMISIVITMSDMILWPLLVLGSTLGFVVNRGVFSEF